MAAQTNIAPVPCPSHIAGFDVECGTIEFKLHTCPLHKLEKLLPFLEGLCDRSQEKTVCFAKAFASPPLVTYSVSSFTMSQLPGGDEEHEEHEHGEGKGPHFDYDAQLLDVTTKGATFKLSTKVEERVISATVTYTARGALKG